MSRLDEELAQAIQEAEEGGGARDSTVPTTRAAAPSKTPKRSIGLLIALLAMGGSILALVMTSFEDAAVYSKGADAVVAERDKLLGRNVKVQGTLVKGTLRRRDEPCEYRFQVEKNGTKLDVVYAQCVVPDTFRDMPGMDVEVTADGKLTAAGHFEATHIMAKCPSKYEMKQRSDQGEAAPHAVGVPAETSAEQARN